MDKDSLVLCQMWESGFQTPSSENFLSIYMMKLLFEFNVTSSNISYSGMYYVNIEILIVAMH